MTAKSVLLHPQGLHPRVHAPTCTSLLCHWNNPLFPWSKKVRTGQNLPPWS